MQSNCKERKSPHVNAQITNMTNWPPSSLASDNRAFLSRTNGGSCSGKVANFLYSFMHKPVLKTSLLWKGAFFTGSFKQLDCERRKQITVHRSKRAAKKNVLFKLQYTILREKKLWNYQRHQHSHEQTYFVQIFESFQLSSKIVGSLGKLYCKSSKMIDSASRWCWQGELRRWSGTKEIICEIKRSKFQ